MERPCNTAIVRINSDIPCRILRFGKEICTVQAHDYTEIYLPKGRHRLSFISIYNTKDKVDIEKEVLDIDYEDIIDIALYSVQQMRLAKEQAEKERLERERQEERMRLELKRKQEEARKPYKIQSLPKLNFYDDIRIWDMGFYKNRCVHIIAEKKQKYALIDKNTFLPVTPFIFERIKQNNNNGSFIWVCENGKWGLFNSKTLSYIISPKYDDINRTESYSSCCTLYTTIGDRWKGGRRGVVNDDGIELVECKYDEVYGDDKYFRVKLNGKWGLIKDNRFVLNCIYDSLWTDGTHPSILYGKYGVLGWGGKKILDFEYDKIEYREPFGCGYHVLIKNGKYGVHICKTGQFIPCQYDSEDSLPNFKLN